MDPVEAMVRSMGAYHPPGFADGPLNRRLALRRRTVAWHPAASVIPRYGVLISQHGVCYMTNAGFPGGYGPFGPTCGRSPGGRHRVESRAIDARAEIGVRVRLTAVFGESPIRWRPPPSILEVAAIDTAVERRWLVRR